jgi:hypothetical protein
MQSHQTSPVIRMNPKNIAMLPFSIVTLVRAVCIVAILASAPLYTATALELRLPVRESEFEDVLACQNADTPHCRSCPANQPTSASLVNYSILQNALTTGGLPATVKIVSSPNSERSRKMVSDGLADVKSDWNFNIDADPQLLKSAPIVYNGEFEKGIYVSQDTLLANAKTRITDVHKLRAVTIRTWRLDWEVLETLRPASLSSAPTTEQLYRLIDAGRADFTLLEFSNAPDMARENNGIRLYPLPDVKVTLPASQHFMISRHIPNADKIVAALDKGLADLRAQGFIRQCLVNSGIINNNVTDWLVLNPQASDPDGKTVAPLH